MIISKITNNHMDYVEGLYKGEDLYRNYRNSYSISLYMDTNKNCNNSFIRFFSYSFCKYIVCNILLVSMLWYVINLTTATNCTRHPLIYLFILSALCFSRNHSRWINQGKCAYFYTCNMLTLYNYKGYNQLCMCRIRDFMYIQLWFSCTYHV